MPCRGGTGRGRGGPYARGFPRVRETYGGRDRSRVPGGGRGALLSLRRGPARPRCSPSARSSRRRATTSSCAASPGYHPGAARRSRSLPTERSSWSGATSRSSPAAWASTCACVCASPRRSWWPPTAALARAGPRPRPRTLVGDGLRRAHRETPRGGGAEALRDRRLGSADGRSLGRGSITVNWSCA